MLRVLFLGWLVLLTGVPAVAQIGQLQFLAQPPAQAAGIGAVLTTRAGAPVINEVLPRSPAAGAGLRPQDTIVWVNYRDVTGMKLEDIVGLIRGPAGTSVAITVLHPGDAKPHTYNLTRAPIMIAP